MTENKQHSLASEMLHEMKMQSKRKDIIIILLIVFLFASNIAWIVAYNLPQEEITTEAYELEGSDDANVIYNGEGEVKINGEDKGN